MAKKRNLSKSSKQRVRQPKQLDPLKYSPIGLERRGLSDKAQRKLYSSLRASAIKRMKRLKDSGYGWTDEAKHKFPTLKDIDKYPSPTYALHAKIMEAVNLLNNPLSLLSNQKFRIEVKTSQTLAKHGYSKAAENVEQFGKFMDAVRARMTGLEFDSERAVKFYERGNRKSDIKKLGDAYLRWQYEEDKLYLENIKNLHPDDYKEYMEQKGRNYDDIMESIKYYEENIRNSGHKRK